MNRVKQYRDRMGLTQKDLAKKARLAQSAISSYESGARRPNGIALLRLSSALNISPEALMGESTLQSHPITDIDAIARTKVILDWWATNAETVAELEAWAIANLDVESDRPLAAVLKLLSSEKIC